MTLWLPAVWLICATAPVHAGPAPPATIVFEASTGRCAGRGCLVEASALGVTSDRRIAHGEQSRVKTSPPAAARLPVTVEFVIVAEPPPMKSPPP